MSVIGQQIESSTLVLTRNRDFSWNFENLDTEGNPTDFPPGELFFELNIGETPTKWQFTIAGSVASLKVESEVVNTIPARTTWQLVFLPQGETAGGSPIALGQVQVQGGN